MSELDKSPQRDELLVIWEFQEIQLLKGLNFEIQEGWLKLLPIEEEEGNTRKQKLSLHL